MVFIKYLVTLNLNVIILVLIALSTLFINLLTKS